MNANIQSVAFHPSTQWQSAELDLDAYLQRINYQGARTADLDTLQALQRAHLDTIPFENLDIMTGDGIDIDLASVQNKLVQRGRGGYCHEHNTLFAAVLERLGFNVTGRSARILMGEHEQVMTPIGHTLLNVNLNNTDWLVDVGVGNVGPRQPIALSAGNQVNHDSWRYRIDRVAERWVLRYWRHDGWFNIYQYSDEAFYRADYLHHNYVVSTFPSSPFTQQLVAQYNGARVRYALNNLQLKTFLPNEPPKTETISAKDLPKVLRETFRLTIAEPQMRWLVELARKLTVCDTKVANA